jgi:hypothetical protein
MNVCWVFQSQALALAAGPGLGHLAHFLTHGRHGFVWETRESTPYGVQVWETTNHWSNGAQHLLLMANLSNPGPWPTFNSSQPGDPMDLRLQYATLISRESLTSHGTWLEGDRTATCRKVEWRKSLIVPLTLDITYNYLFVYLR